MIQALGIFLEHSSRATERAVLWTQGSGGRSQISSQHEISTRLRFQRADLPSLREDEELSQSPQLSSVVLTMVWNSAVALFFDGHLFLTGP